MNCERLEKLIALWVEGDLEIGEARRIEAHLDECGACREFAAALKESQLGVKNLRDEAADSLTLERVRSRVLEQISTGQRSPRWFFGWAWGYALAGVLAVLAGGVILWRSHVPRDIPKPEVQSAALTEPLPNLPVPAPAKPPKRRRVQRRPQVDAVKQPPAASEPLMVKLFTDDPNVVIIWLVDRNGG